MELSAITEASTEAEEAQRQTNEHFDTVVVRGDLLSQCIGPMGQTCSTVVVVRGDLQSQCIGPMGQTC